MFASMVKIVSSTFYIDAADIFRAKNIGRKGFINNKMDLLPEKLNDYNIIIHVYQWLYI